MTEASAWACLRESGDTYAVPAAEVMGIVGSERLQANPRPGPALGWLLDVAGDLPVLALPGSAAGRHENRQVVLLHAPRPVGLAVDTVASLLTIPSERQRQLPPRLAGPLFSRAAMHEGQIVLRTSAGAVAAALATSDFRTGPVETAAPGIDAPAGIPELAPLNAPAGRMLIFVAAGGRTRFGLAARQVIEIIRPDRWRRLPGAPESTLGMVTWRDEPVPIVDLERALGFRGAETVGGLRLLIARSLAVPALIAFAVERVTAILQEPLPGQRRPLPDHLRTDWMPEIYEHDRLHVLLPDLDRMVGAL